MKAIKGYSNSYKAEMGAGSYVKEFTTIEDAGKYLSEKFGESLEEMIKSIIDDTNEDAIYFSDGHTLLFELSE